jgi:hypothetical protein
MTDYYPMIARRVVDLQGSIAARHEFYWLARAELAVQLCGLNPSLTQSEMMCERLALDEAIRKVEAECLQSVEAQCLNPAQTSPPTPKSGAAGHQSTRGFADIRLCSDMRPVTQGQQRQRGTAISPESPSTSTSPLIFKFAGALVVIASAVTLYWQGHRFTALLPTSPATQTPQAVKSSPTITYYVGQLGELASTATRKLDRLVLPSN